LPEHPETEHELRKRKGHITVEDMKL